MGSRWRWRAFGAGLGVQLWVLPVFASDLSWSGPPECDASEQLLFQIERALGAPLADVGQLHLQVHVERAAPDARARLRIGSTEESRAGGTSTRAGQRERRLAAPDCARLVDTLAVAITLALEAEGSPADATTGAAQSSVTASSVAASSGSAGSASLARGVSNADGSGPLSSSAAAPVSEWNDVAAPRADSAASATALPAITARVVADSGSLPKPALGMALGVRLIWPRV